MSEQLVSDFSNWNWTQAVLSMVVSSSKCFAPQYLLNFAYINKLTLSISIRLCEPALFVHNLCSQGNKLRNSLTKRINSISSALPIPWPFCHLIEIVMWSRENGMFSPFSLLQVSYFTKIFFRISVIFPVTINRVKNVVYMLCFCQM